MLDAQGHRYRIRRSGQIRKYTAKLQENVPIRPIGSSPSADEYGGG